MKNTKSLEKIRHFICITRHTNSASLPHICARVLTILLLILVSNPMVGQAANNTSSTTYVRPYGPNAPWNRPVKKLPIHPQSQKYRDLLWKDATSSRTEGNINLTFDGYTYPVYETNNATTVYRVVERSKWGNLHNKTIPWNPTWLGAAGSDRQVIILDPPTGREWNLWQVNVNTRNKVVNTTIGNLVQAGIRSGDGSDPGDYRTKENGFRGSRGVGIQYLAMLVRPEEIEKGVIEHALSMPIRITNGLDYVAPATKLEHPNNPPGIPEGMRFALDITNQEIEEWIRNFPQGLTEATKRAARIIAVALRDYGWFITDTTGGDPFFQFEDRLTASEWKNLGLGHKVISRKEYPRDLLDGLITKNRIYTLVPSDQYNTTVTTTQDNGSSIQNVIRFTLVDADTNTDIQTLKDGDIIDYSKIGKSLSIRATTRPSVVGSVRFGLDDDRKFRTDNFKPYTINGDKGDDYPKWTPSLGAHTITATPYTEKNADGRKGPSLTINITVVDKSSGSLNQSPIANSDRVSTQIGQSVMVNVLSNDSDPEGDNLSITNVARPSNGKALFNGSMVTYIPDAEFTGTDLFDYTISDANGGTANATLTIAVQGRSNRFPVVLQGKPRPEEATVDFHVDKPSKTDGLAWLRLQVFDADAAKEGKLEINGNGLLQLFGDQARLRNNRKTVEIAFSTSARWWNDGLNKLRFVHTRSGGYRIENASVDFEIPRSPAKEAAHSALANKSSEFVGEFISRTVYEDAEDGSIDSWYQYNTGTVKNIRGGVNGSMRAIEIRGDIENDVFRLGNKNNSDWNNNTEFFARFSVVFNELSSGAIYFKIDTSKGIKHLVYTNKKITDNKDSDLIYFNLGNLTHGQWHTFQRDLKKDLVKEYPGAELIKVKGLFVYGSLKLDNIILLRYE